MTISMEGAFAGPRKGGRPSYRSALGAEFGLTAGQAKRAIEAYPDEPRALAMKLYAERIREFHLKRHGTPPSPRAVETLRVQYEKIRQHENRERYIAGPCSEDPDLWFSEDTEKIQQAKAGCGSCFWQQQCLAWVQEHPQPYGVWGGLSPEERGVTNHHGRRKA